MEEAESLVGRKKLNQNQKKSNEGLISLALRRDFVSYIIGVATALLLVLLYATMKDSTKELNIHEVEYKSPVLAPTTTVLLQPEPEPERQNESAPVSLPTTPVTSPLIVPTKNDPTPMQPPISNTGEKTVKNFYSKVATFVPLMDPPLPDEETAQNIADNWGKWGFWDGDENTRPTYDYLSKYPNNDCPGDDLPNDAWQADAVFVNHYLDDADKLISRAMEAIFAEYGHPRQGLEPEELAERMQQFYWDKIEMANATGPPPKYTKRGDRGNGGWTTKRSEEGLVRRLLHAMMTSDTFTVVMGGHSAAAGEGYVQASVTDKEQQDKISRYKDVLTT